MDINDLPTEMLCPILVNVVLEQVPEMLSEFKGYDHPAVVMSQVCRRWPAVATQTPTLWCHIHSQFSQRIVSTMLHNSKASPLFVVLHGSVEHQNNSATIVKHLSRIQVLKISIKPGHSLLHILSPLKSVAQQLFELQVTHEPSAHLKLHHDFLGGTRNPSLQKICLDWVALSWDSAVIQNLTTLSLKLSFDNPVNWDPFMCQIVDILLRCPELENLTLQVYVHDGGQPDPSVRVKLPFLKHLHLIVTDIRDFNLLVSILDLPWDVKFTLHFPDHWDSPLYMQIPIVWPQHLTSESTCLGLNCHIGLEYLEIDASIRPHDSSQSITQVLVRMGDETEWENEATRLKKVNNMSQVIQCLRDTIHASFLSTTTSLQLLFGMPLRGNAEDLRNNLTDLLRSVPNIHTLSVSLCIDLHEDFSRAACKVLIDRPMLRSLRVELALVGVNKWIHFGKLVEFVANCRKLTKWFEIHLIRAQLLSTSGLKQLTDLTDAATIDGF